jgi:hypothetical protein
MDFMISNHDCNWNGLVLHLYGGHCCHRNDFLVIWNDTTAVKETVAEMPWQELRGLMVQDDQSARQQLMGVQLGTTSNVSTTRQGQLDGISRPVYREYTFLPTSVQSFLVGSKLS